MRESPVAYLPTDRRRAHSDGDELAARTSGAALFADISGFTPLTEALVTSLGPQRGAEALPIELNRIYDALIACVDDYRGSVLGFSGDAITCWFDDSGDGWSSGPESSSVPSSVLRATVCALAMQRVMEQFATFDIPGAGTVSLAVKVAVAVGPVVRFLAGDPSIQVIDVIAGETLQRLARAEHQAAPGDVIVDEFGVAALGDLIQVDEWRVDGETQERFGVVRHIDTELIPNPWPETLGDSMTAEALRPWLLPPVAERLLAGGGEFLTELRPAVSLFVRFGGIDYDNDPRAGEQLDAFVRRVQTLLAPYEAFVLQLTIGDKGSYLNTSFGAPIAHGDDVVRALRAALELQSIDDPSVGELQIGVAQGRFRTGAYGGVTRRTYGVLGDEVNLAARLMMVAGVGEILVDESVQRVAPEEFTWRAVEPFRAKGKSRLVQSFQLEPLSTSSSSDLRTRHYAFSMIGRNDEMEIVRARLGNCLAGRGQVVGIEGEAGIGKTRLVSEVVRMARRLAMVTYGGECQSHGVDSSYLVWQPIVRGIFTLDSSSSFHQQLATVEKVLTEVNPRLLDRLPLLGYVLGISIPDSSLTSTFDAALRKLSLESLLIEVIRFQASRVPILIVLEDTQWIDPLSHDLFMGVARAIGEAAVTVMFARRPPDQEDNRNSVLQTLGHCTMVRLGDLSEQEIVKLVHAKVRDRGGDTATLSPELVTQLCLRAEGNPFYVEELVNFLTDQGFSASDPDSLSKIALPDSLHSLILGRIDRLTDEQKTVMKVASVVGRTFPVSLLEGAYEFGDSESLQNCLRALTNLDLTVLERPLPELAYFFKHVLTQKVAYETLSFATRSALHEQIGLFIESSFAHVLDGQIDVLAHHYDRSENLAKRRHYLRKAGIAAKNGGANVSAANYFERLLPLLLADDEAADRCDVLLLLGQVHDITGAWGEAEETDLLAIEVSNHLVDPLVATQFRALAHEALGLLERKRGDYQKSLQLFAESANEFSEIGEVESLSRVTTLTGELHRLQGRFADASSCFELSLQLAAGIDDMRSRQIATADALKGAGTVESVQGNHGAARSYWNQSMMIRKEIDDAPAVAAILNNLAVVARLSGDLQEAQRLGEESLRLWRTVGNLWAVGQLLNNQGCVASDRGDYVQARSLLGESLDIRRRLGDRAGLALSLTTLAEIVVDEGDFLAAIDPLRESLELSRVLDDSVGIAYAIEGFLAVSAGLGYHPATLRFAGFASELRTIIGAPLAPAERVRVERFLEMASETLGDGLLDGLAADGAALVSSMDFERLFGEVDWC